jgi:hypothetical protein
MSVGLTRTLKLCERIVDLYSSSAGKNPADWNWFPPNVTAIAAVEQEQSRSTAGYFAATAEVARCFPIAARSSE